MGTHAFGGFRKLLLESIDPIAKAHNVDLLVMGRDGGRPRTRVLASVHIPVLVVPAGAHI